MLYSISLSNSDCHRPHYALACSIPNLQQQRLVESPTALDCAAPEGSWHCLESRAEAQLFRCDSLPLLRRLHSLLTA